MRFHALINFSSIIIIVTGYGCARLKPISLVDEPRQDISTSELEYFKTIEAYLPMLPDSVINQYRQYNKIIFREKYQHKLSFTIQLIDSLNGIVGPYWSIDTVSIDHSIENFGTAAYLEKTLYISSSYFFIYPDLEVLRSIITHEFGHIFYSRLTPYNKSVANDIWSTLRSSALLYLFRDGEYSHNARFGGHPEDSSSELFASAYNLFSNQREEFDVRLKYVDDFHLKLISDFKNFIEHTTTDHPLLKK
jgi:hypothetical protein